jgi:hypothetical protein
LAVQLLLRSGPQLDGFLAAAVTPLLPPGHPALAASQLRLRLLVAAGIVNHRAVGQGGKRC